jgi:hypothetical protein
MAYPDIALSLPQETIEYLREIAQASRGDVAPVTVQDLIRTALYEKYPYIAFMDRNYKKMGE